jgi:hypothetical protein
MLYMGPYRLIGDQREDETLKSAEEFPVVKDGSSSQASL